MANTNKTFEALIAYLNGINQEEKQKIASAVNGIQADPVKRRISIKEYTTLLETKLCEENLRRFWSDHLMANRLVVSLVGDFSETTLLEY